MLSVANAITVDGICYNTCLYISFTAAFYGYVLGECFFFLFLKFRNVRTYELQPF